jgi:hypothetical protein
VSPHAYLLHTINMACLLQTMNTGDADQGQVQFVRTLDNPKISRLTAPLLEQGFVSLSFPVTPCRSLLASLLACLCHHLCLPHP